MAREMRLRIVLDICQTCRRCLASEVCKMRAIVRIDSDEPPFLDIERCYDCRLCISACPFNAVQIGVLKKT